MPVESPSDQTFGVSKLEHIVCVVLCSGCEKSQVGYFGCFFEENLELRSLVDNTILNYQEVRINLIQMKV